MIMNKLSISDWPFSVKFLAPALVAVLVMLSMGTYAVLTLDQQASQTAQVVERSNTTMTEIVNVDFTGSILLAKISGDVQALNGRFYELLTLETAELNKSGAEDLLKLRDTAKKL